MIADSRIAGERVLIECAPEHEDAAHDILAELARLGSPRDGQRIRFGWSLLTLRGEAQGLRVCEPDFAGEAETGLSPTLDVTIAVIASQLEWLRRLGEEGADAAFDQHAIVVKGALAAPDIFALRGETRGESDSGWSIAPVPEPGGQIDMTGLEAIPIHRMFSARPGLLAILPLPAGYLVTLSGNDVAEVTSPGGRVMGL